MPEKTLFGNLLIPTPTTEQLFLSKSFLLLYLNLDQEDHRNNNLLLREACIVESMERLFNHKTPDLDPDT